jgi:hypothetical protein
MPLLLPDHPGFPGVPSDLDTEEAFFLLGGRALFDA